MALILCLETTTKVCSVALAQNGNIIAVQESHDAQYSHAEKLNVFIQDVFSQTSLHLKNIDAVAVSKGPGSYTGLRIGISTAKGLCYALEKPLIAINSLKAMAAGFITNHLDALIPKSLFCPMIDARRMEVFCAVYNKELKEIQNTEAKIVDSNSFSELLKTQSINFFGDGALKCKAEINHEQAIFFEDFNPSAKFMGPLAELLFTKNEFEDVAYFEPFYLKDFVDSKGIHKK